jgi:hypothetical protein
MVPRLYDEKLRHIALRAIFSRLSSSQEKKTGDSDQKSGSPTANYAQNGLIGAQFGIKFVVKQVLIPLYLKRYLREFTDTQHYSELAA